MRKKETLKEKAFRLWKKAKLPDFFNKKGPKKTPAWLVYACHLKYTNHAPAWRRAADFIMDYHDVKRHWTAWPKALEKWPAWVWDALKDASVGEEHCEIAAIDGTTMARSNPSQHYLHRIDSDGKINRPVQQVVMVDVYRRKFLSWRVRAKPRGEKCDVRYLLDTSPILPDGVLMDKGFDNEPLHNYLRDQGVWSVAPTRKGCKRGRYRKQLRDCFDWYLYWQRNIVESLFSAIKRLFGVHLHARSWRAQRAEIYSRLISYNIRAITTLYFLLSQSYHNLFKHHANLHGA
jgi:hypothetical protein